MIIYTFLKDRGDGNRPEERVASASRRLRDEDRRRLQQAFAAAFDRSRLESVLARSERSQEGLELLGEGTHFVSWRILGSGGGAGLTKAPAVVLKRAKAAWADPGDPKARRWIEAVRQVGRSGLPLVPPLEVVRADGPRGPVLGLAMPFGDQPLASAAAHWLPVDELVAELRRGLAALGLALDDVAQGRCWDGVPFLFDFSDLGAP
jgi:hypothetical protein